jgi:hypothetical protein
MDAAGFFFFKKYTQPFYVLCVDLNYLSNDVFFVYILRKFSELGYPLFLPSGLSLPLPYVIIYPCLPLIKLWVFFLTLNGLFSLIFSDLAY